MKTEPFMTPEDAERIYKKHLRAKAILTQVEKGEEGNLINLTPVLEVKLWKNNPDQWRKIYIDSPRKTK